MNGVMVIPEPGDLPEGAFPVSLRIHTPAQRVVVSAHFRMIPGIRALKNVETIALGYLSAGDKVAFEILSRDDRPKVLATYEVSVSGDGETLVMPGDLTINYSGKPAAEAKP